MVDFSWIREEVRARDIVGCRAALIKLIQDNPNNVEAIRQAVTLIDKNMPAVWSDHNRALPNLDVPEAEWDSAYFQSLLSHFSMNFSRTRLEDLLVVAEKIFAQVPRSQSLAPLKCRSFWPQSSRSWIVTAILTLLCVFLCHHVLARCCMHDGKATHNESHQHTRFHGPVVKGTPPSTVQNAGGQREKANH